MSDRLPGRAANVFGGAAIGLLSAGLYAGYLVLIGRLLLPRLEFGMISGTGLIKLVACLAAIRGFILFCDYPISAVRRYPRSILSELETWVVLCAPAAVFIYPLILRFIDWEAIAFLGAIFCSFLIAVAFHALLPSLPAPGRQQHLRGSPFRLTFEEARARAEKLRSGGGA